MYTNTRMVAYVFSYRDEYKMVQLYGYRYHPNVGTTQIPYWDEYRDRYIGMVTGMGTGVSTYMGYGYIIRNCTFNIQKSYILLGIYVMVFGVIIEAHHDCLVAKKFLQYLDCPPTQVRAATVNKSR